MKIQKYVKKDIIKVTSILILLLPATYQSERDETKDYAFLSLNYNYLLKYQI